MKGQQWARLLPLALLIVLGLAGLRGAVGTPRWDGPLHRDGLAVGLATEAVFAVLAVLTLRRHRSVHQDLVARKLRVTISFALGIGAVAVAAVMLIGLNLHLFTRRPVQSLPRPTASATLPFKPLHPHKTPASDFHLPLAALLYTLLVLLLLDDLLRLESWVLRVP